MHCSRRLPSSLLVLVLAACAAPPSQQAPAASVVVVAPPSATADAGPPSRASALGSATTETTADSVRSAHVDANGCRFEGSVERITLSYGAAREAWFADADDVPHAAVVLGDSAGAPSSAIFDILGLHFDVELRERGVAVYPRVPLALGGVLDPYPSSALTWLLTSDGLVVTSQTPEALRYIPFERASACTDVGLDVKPFPARPLPKAKRLAKAKESLPLAPTPGAAPAAALPAGVVVSVLTEQGKQAEIAYEAEGGIFHGWTPRAALVVEKPAVRHGYGTLSGRPPTEHFPGGHVCDEAVPIYARTTKAPATLVRVGNVRAGKRVALAPAKEGEPYRVLLAEQRIDSTERGKVRARSGFELVVDESKIVACRAAP
jgi:hypothetical protein